jgi:RsmE family RNA methyltransferase
MNIILFENDEMDAPLGRSDERAVHLVKVLHKRAGDEFDAGIVDGPVGRGRIERIDADRAVYISFTPTGPAPGRLPLEIGVGFPRPIQLRRLLREASSIGVAAIALFPTDLGEKSYRDTTLFDSGRARRALLEGAAQSRDTTLPAVARFASLRAWLATLPAGRERPRVVADNAPGGRPFAALLPGRGFTLAVGSERGWSEAERALFRAAGFQSCSLGSRALRTETACAAGAALLAMLCEMAPAAGE